MKLRRDQSSAMFKLFYEDPETAYNKNLTTRTCNGVPVKSILPALGYFLISCQLSPCFQAVALIDDHRTPVILGEMISVFDDHLVSGDDSGKGRQLNGRIRVIVILFICLVGTILIFWFDWDDTFFV